MTLEWSLERSEKIKRRVLATHRRERLLRVAMLIGAPVLFAAVVLVAAPVPAPRSVAVPASVSTPANTLVVYVPRFDFAGDRLELPHAAPIAKVLASVPAARKAETPEVLFARADALRDQGARDEAVKVLQQIVREHASHTLAAPAAFTIGKLLTSSDRAAARAAFLQAAALAPDGPLSARARELAQGE